MNKDYQLILEDLIKTNTLEEYHKKKIPIIEEQKKNLPKRIRFLINANPKDTIQAGIGISRKLELIKKGPRT